MASSENENTAAQIYLLGKTYLANNQGQFYIKNDPIIHMAAGDRHTIIITESGRAFAFGDNSSGQLGLGNTDKVEKVSCIKSLKSNETGEKVILAACGRESSIVATDRGSIYSFGSNSRSQLGYEPPSEHEINQPLPTKITSFKSKNTWKQIAMGAEHACALTDEGLVYVWGANDEGQCGQIKKHDVISKPRELRMEQPVVAISCGYYHTALVTEDGHLYLMGSNDDRQLGCTVPDKFAGPVKVSIPDKVMSVACGYQHTVVLTDKGEVYVCGTGNRGQLGLSSRVPSAETFELIPNLPKRVTAIAAGEAHTAIIGSRKDLFVFGDGKHGKLGASTQSNEFDPWFVEKFKTYDVLKVVCGGCQTIVLAQKKPFSTTKTSESDEDNALTLTSTLHYKSPARNKRVKDLTERSLHVSDSMDSTMKQIPPLHALRTERNDDDDDKSDKELSESIRSRTFNQTHTITNGKFKPTQTSGTLRPTERGTNEIKTGVFDRTVRLNRDDSPKTPARNSRLERESPPSPRRKKQDSDSSSASPRRKREKSISPLTPRRKKSSSSSSSPDEQTKSPPKKQPEPLKRFEKQSSPIATRRRADSDDDENQYKKRNDKSPRPKKQFESDDDNDSSSRSPRRTTKQPPPPPVRRSSLQMNAPKSNVRDGNQTIGSKPVGGVRGSFRSNATKSLAKPATTTKAEENKPTEQTGFFRRIFGGKSSTPSTSIPPPAPTTAPAAAASNPASRTCSVM